MKSPQTASRPAIACAQLTIQLPNGRELLRNISVQIQPGEFVLLVGPSGSGKSTLLKLFAGLDRDSIDGASFRVSGSVQVLDRSYPNLRPQDVGLVFQSLALFDELTAEQNVQFALDHASPSGRPVSDSRSWLEKLNVPLRGRLANFSAGERQRVAIARTLATDPALLLFDEPTTGLDPTLARQVAGLIAQTHREFGRTIVVVTHDFTPFLEYRPRLILVDPSTHSLRDVTREELREFFEATSSPDDSVESPGAFDIGDPSTPQSNSPHSRNLTGGHRSGNDAYRPAAAQHDAISAWRKRIMWPGEALLFVMLGVVSPFLGWSRPTWKLRYFWHYLRMMAMGTTALYVILSGVMLGFVFITFSFSNLPFSNITVPLASEEFLAATGYSMYRVVTPIMIAVLLAGKCGASAAADLGARRLTRQMEAMRNLRASPVHYLHGNLALAAAIAGPFLAILGFLAGAQAAMVAYLMTSPETTVAGFHRNFYALLWPADSLFPRGTGWVILKGATGGLLVSGLSYAIGSRAKFSSVDVSRDVGLTIFWASLGVLLLHAIYSFIEF